MKLFNKTKWYNLMVSKEANLKVQRFADEHCEKGYPFRVQSDGNLVLIDFYSSEKPEKLISELKRELEADFNVRIGESFIHITNK
jgi:hypothetical protein